MLDPSNLATVATLKVATVSSRRRMTGPTGGRLSKIAHMSKSAMPDTGEIKAESITLRDDDS